MRIIFIFLTLILISNCTSSSTNPDIEVYLFDLDFNGETWTLSNPQNISQNEGYDNQPSFSPDGSTLYYTSNRDGETDLVAYNIDSGNKTWLTNTESRSEYSPTITPDGEHLSFITLSSNGVQEFRKIHLESGEETLIENDPIIGYFVWMDEESYLCFVLATDDQPSTLQLHNTETNEKTILGENPGRSFHHIPGASAVSYIQTNNDVPSIYAYYYETDSSEIITSTLENSQDMVWLPTGHMIMGSDSELFINNEQKWDSLFDLKNYSLSGVTRMAVNTVGTRIAIVVEE